MHVVQFYFGEIKTQASPKVVVAYDDVGISVSQLESISIYFEEYIHFPWEILIHYQVLEYPVGRVKGLLVPLVSVLYVEKGGVL